MGHKIRPSGFRIGITETLIGTGVQCSKDGLQLFFIGREILSERKGIGKRENRHQIRRCHLLIDVVQGRLHSAIDFLQPD